MPSDVYVSSVVSGIEGCGDLGLRKREFRTSLLRKNIYPSEIRQWGPYEQKLCVDIVQSSTVHYLLINAAAGNNLILYCTVQYCINTT